MTEVQETAVWSRAGQCGFIMCKSEQFVATPDDGGQYMLVDSYNKVVMGERFDASLEDIDTIGTRPRERPRRGNGRV